MKYNLACGPLPIHKQHLDYMGDMKDWVLVDLYHKAPGIKNWDVTKLDEIEDGTAEELYASHFLEHVAMVDVPIVLQTWRNKLVSGGKLMLNVPHLYYALKLLQKYESGVPLGGYYNQYHGEHGIMSIIYGSQSHEGEFHKSGFTKYSIRSLLEQAKFHVKDIWLEMEAHDMECILVEAYK